MKMKRKCKSFLFDLGGVVIVRWTFFVLDFDGTYDNEYENELGVEPLVFAVLEKDIVHAHQIAKEAHEIFHDSSDDLCIGDYFEDLLARNKIPFMLIGSLKISFGERQKEFLSDCIEREVV